MRRYYLAYPLDGPWNTTLPALRSASIVSSTVNNLVWPGTPFTLNLAPDSKHKYNISGGPPYGMAVPDARIDGLFLHEWHHTTFVDYLRVCFLSGGLPMREWVAVDLSMLKSVWEGGKERQEVTEAVAYLRQGLLPI